MNTVVKSSSFESFEEAFYQVPEFAKRLRLILSITQKEDGTFGFFGEEAKFMNIECRMKM